MHEPSRGKPSIASHAISKSFVTGRMNNQVIRDSAIAVWPGELTLMVGPSGSGKSTLLSMLSGLLRPDSGKVVALEHDLTRMDEKALDRFRLRHCGFVFQGFNLFNSLSALDNVILPLQYLGVRGQQAIRRARRALEEVGLGARLSLRPAELSGGEKQRLSIARALVKEPPLLFADEPTSALDTQNGQIVVDLLKRIAIDHRATVLGVTHDPRLLSHADRVIHLEDGAVVREQRNPRDSPQSQGPDHD